MIAKNVLKKEITLYQKVVNLWSFSLKLEFKEIPFFLIKDKAISDGSHCSQNEGREFQNSFR